MEPKERKHGGHPVEFTCVHTKLKHCVPCDATECEGCGKEWLHVECFDEKELDESLDKMLDEVVDEAVDSVFEDKK